MKTLHLKYFHDGIRGSQRLLRFIHFRNLPVERTRSLRNSQNNSRQLNDYVLEFHM